MPISKPPFDSLMTQGGDDRLDLLANGLNKYNLNPCDFDGVFSRASCTCSTFTPEGYAVARELYERLNNDVFDEVRHEQEQKIKSLINYKHQDRFDVFFAPSGSDLCYYSLLFSKLIRPERDIYNVVTCPEELGSGSIAAHTGRYFGKRNQFGDSLEKGTELSKSLKVKMAEFTARDSNGNIVNHSHSITTKIHEHYHSHSVIANLVIGSKSGIENNVSIVSQTPEDVFWTVDLCQFRASRVLLNGLIGMNCAAMITGSKFYQSPPFCAVMLVPKTLSDRFQPAAHQETIAFKNIFSAHDIPSQFPWIRNHLRDYRNYGLLLRWEAALFEMTALAELESYQVNQAIQKWNDFILATLADDELFELMPGQEVTNKTIVSFRVRKSKTEFLSHDELRDLYQNICQQEIKDMSGVQKILFGQPVKYEDKSFIRIALGSNELRKFATGDPDFKMDRLMIHNIARTVRELHWS